MTIASAGGGGVLDVRRLPEKDCHGRFCTAVGPFTDRGIEFVGSSPPLIIGWCDFCRRRICSRCATIERLASSAPAETFRLCCLYCGDPLGVGGRSSTIAT
jgi:hypothetical protein